MTRINKFLRSEAATITVLLMALAAQTPHAAWVFANIVGSELVTGWLFAIAMESAVLLFVIRGRIRVSYAFASISVLMNLSYYWMHGINIFAMHSAPAWLVALVLPTAIALYSHDVADHADTVQVERKPQGAPQSAHVVDASQPRLAPVRTQEPAKNAASEATKQTPEERRHKLAQMRSNGHADATVKELAEILKVNPSTVSRDLRLIENGQKTA